MNGVVPPLLPHMPARRGKVHIYLVIFLRNFHSVEHQVIAT